MQQLEYPLLLFLDGFGALHYLACQIPRKPITSQCQSAALPRPGFFFAPDSRPSA
jgi:hypothetical protein